MALSSTARPIRIDGDDARRVTLWPTHPVSRWLVRLAYAAPFLVLAVLLGDTSGAPFATPNATLAQQVRLIDPNETGVVAINSLYPPLTTITARLLLLLPFGTTSLSVAGALIAGVAAHRLVETMWRRRFAWYQTAAFSLALIGTPLFGYLVTTDYGQTLCLTLFALGMADLVRFTALANTQAGFRAGLYFAGAALSSTMGIVYVLIAAAIVPLIKPSWRARGARWANLLVVTFPALGCFAAAALLQAAFAGTVLAILPSGFSLDADRLQTLATTFSSVQGLLILAPVAVGMLGTVLLRRPAAMVIMILLLLAVLTAYGLTLLPLGSVGVIFMLILVVLLSITPGGVRRWQRVTLSLLALSLLGIGWADALGRNNVLLWMERLAG
ncbi:hypothetical protein ACF3NT_00915 [Naumannella halotolerans]|uniref:Dolichyl-phosphate-mannose-protein mannosyltransferase n=1 Tax=Naumannella halotolerans TaxID=993414 RepID=A0A4R7J5J3_9ACTN|nr:hypothetical protein [Naumannella halotolerans]TDT32622.1 hypothetical protein CLV29_0203 [Naumannella halotolerans]